jgi:hypothetical protein
MANVVTYAIVSGPDDLAAVREHDLIEENGFEVHREEEGDGETDPSVTFTVGSALEEHEALEGPCRHLSEAFPEAVVVYTEVEERFDNVERLKVRVFRDGRRAGHLEHGSVFNVGAG